MIIKLHTDGKYENEKNQKKYKKIDKCINNIGNKK